MRRADLELVGEIAWRFLRGGQSRLLDGTARAALLATALGVTAMVIAMALMTGYREDLQLKMMRGHAAVVAYPLAGDDAPMDAALLARLQTVPGVGAVRPVLYGQGALSGPGQPDGVEVTLRGVETAVGGLEDTPGLELAAGLDPAAGLARAGLPGVVLGGELAERLGVEPGQPLRLMVLAFDGGRPHFRYRSVGVAGRFSSGFSEFDRSWVVLERELLESLMGRPAGSAFFEIGVDDPASAGRIAEAARGVLGQEYLVTDWQDLNRDLFTALRVQQIALFFVLGLIVLVSNFNVASSLVVLVRERMRDIGVLATLGLDPRRLRALFLLFGIGLGLAGTLAGLAIGSAAAWVLTEFELIRFDADVAAVYFIRSVPFRVRPAELAAIAAFTLVVTTIACWLPARRAARVRPAEALRYE